MDVSNSLKVQNIPYIDLARIFGILFVVYWHVYTIAYPTSSFIRYLAPFAAMMPLITFVSGYLFRLLYNIGKYTNYVSLLKNKAKRLLIPLVVFTPFYVNYGHLNSVSEMLNGLGPLWYLVMLFWQFVFVYPFYMFIYDRLNSSVKKFFIVSLFFPLIYVPVPDFVGIHYFTRWVFFFLLGGFVYDCHTLKKIMKEKRVAWCTIVCSLVAIVFCQYVIPISNFYKAVGGNILRLSSIIFVCIFCFSCQKWLFFVLKFLKKNSFGIYLMHALVIKLLIEFIPDIKNCNAIWFFVVTIFFTNGLVWIFKRSLLKYVL